MSARAILGARSFVLIQLNPERGIYLSRVARDGYGTAAGVRVEDLQAVRGNEGNDGVDICLRGPVAFRVLLRRQELALSKGRVVPMLVIGKRRSIRLATKNERG
jgi:hypothetical protein